MIDIRKALNEREQIYQIMKRDTVTNFICEACEQPVSRRLFPRHEVVDLCPVCATDGTCAICTYRGPLTVDGICPDCALSNSDKY